MYSCRYVYIRFKMHSIVINLIYLLKLDYLISYPRKPIRINRNECYS